MKRLPKGTRYYFVNTRMETTGNMDFGDMDASKRFEVGNYFETKEECDIYATYFGKELQARFKEITW